MSPKAKQRTIRLVLILGLVTGICLFLVGALRENIVYFKTPSELLVLTDHPKKLRLGGLVVKGTLYSKNSQHNFMVTDQKTTIQVMYSGRLPDLFRENQGIVAIGNYDSSKKIFNANQLLAKHDQYYRPPKTTE
ncbi:MAG: cytochrome c maturation protein CcmE [Alphaproteobacteria bacterium]